MTDKLFMDVKDVTKILEVSDGKAYELNKGIVGIYIHGLKDKNGNQTTKGSNPFYNILIGKNKERLSKYVECYESPHLTSTYVYDDIKNNIEQLIEDAIGNAGTY